MPKICRTIRLDLFLQTAGGPPRSGALASAEPHVGDVGVVVEATLHDADGSVVAIDGATVTLLRFRKPSGVVMTKPATLSDDRTTLRYVTVDGDLTPAGIWSVEPTSKRRAAGGRRINRASACIPPWGPSPDAGPEREPPRADGRRYNAAPWVRTTSPTDRAPGSGSV